MRRNFVLFFWGIVWLGAVGSSAFAQNYHWPTTASKRLSSSFCEYRPGHFHSAIDIKTWNREGYPVFAIASGRIYRIRVSPFGYGKVLYLKLDDGRMAVYAHLQKFNKALEKAVREQQVRNRRYTIDWYPRNWRVKKGQLLAYTGQTGIGVPHLHFEIRDAQNHPLNPLKFYAKEIEDKVAPVLQELLVLPLTAQSLVNDAHSPQIIPLKKTGKNLYGLKDSLAVYGKIGLALRAFDKADGVYNHLAYYRARLFWDHREVFAVSYDTLDFARTRLADVEIYYPFKTLLHKRFRKLFIEPFNRLPFYYASPGNGYLEVTGGKHHFRLEVEDFFGNSSVLQGTVHTLSPQRPVVEFARKFGDEAFLKLVLPKDIVNLSFAAGADRKHWETVEYFEILENQFTGEGKRRLIIKTDLKDTNNTYLRLTIRPREMEPYSCLIALTDSCPYHPWQLVNAGKRWLLRANGVSCRDDLQLALKVNGRQQVWPMFVSEYGMEAVLPAPETDSDSLRISVTLNQKSVFDTTLVYHVLFPGEKQIFAFFDNRLRLQSVADAVYDTTLFTVRVSDTLPRISGVPILSPLYAFDWYPQILRKGVTIQIRCDSLRPYWHKIGMYGLTPSGALSFFGGRCDSLTRSVQIKTRLLGHYVLAADTTAPLVEILAPKQGATLTRLKEIRFSLLDSLSGIGSDRNIRLFVDSTFVVAEWDPERHIVVGRPHWTLKPGKHVVTATVQDMAGNWTKKSVLFSIVKKR